MLNLPNTRLRIAGLLFLILMFLISGINHFSNPNLYVSIMPPYLPMQSELSYISGIFEILGAIGLLFSKIRKLVGYALLIMLILMFPANLHMAVYPESFPMYSELTIYVRLPLQLVFMAWVYWAALRKKAIGDNELY